MNAIEKYIKYREMLDNGALTQEQFDKLVDELDVDDGSVEFEESDTDQTESISFDFSVNEKPADRMTKISKRLVFAIIVAVIAIGVVIAVNVNNLRKQQDEQCLRQMASYADRMAVLLEGEEGDGQYSCIEMINLVNEVWGDAIFGTRHSGSSKYLEDVEQGDFNTAIRYVYEDDAVVKFLEQLEQMESDARTATILSDCPKGCEEVAEAYKAYVDSFSALVDKVTYPNSNYRNYWNDTIKLYNDCIHNYKKLYDTAEVVARQNE